MFKNLKAIFIAFIAITVMFGCKGPPRPGWHRHRAVAQTTTQKAQTENEKAQAAAEREQEKLDKE